MPSTQESQLSQVHMHGRLAEARELALLASQQRCVPKAEWTGVGMQSRHLRLSYVCLKLCRNLIIVSKKHRVLIQDCTRALVTGKYRRIYYSDHPWIMLMHMRTFH